MSNFNNIGSTSNNLVSWATNLVNDSQSGIASALSTLADNTASPSATNLLTKVNRYYEEHNLHKPYNLESIVTRVAQAKMPSWWSGINEDKRITYIVAYEEYVHYCYHLDNFPPEEIIPILWNQRELEENRHKEEVAKKQAPQVKSELQANPGSNQLTQIDDNLYRRDEYTTAYDNSMCEEDPEMLGKRALYYRIIL